MKKIITVAVCAVMAFGLIGCSGTSKSDTNSSSAEASVSSPYSLKYGDLLDTTVTTKEDGYTIFVVKAGADLASSNNLTINQQYMNAVDLVQNQGADQYDEVQYWAVADLGNGDEKIVSFTLPSGVINEIVENDLSAGLLPEYADDLYINQKLK